MFSFFKKKKETDKEEKNINIICDYEDVSDIMHYFKQETGITFEQQKNILKNKLTLFCKTNKIYSFRELLNSLKKDDEIKQKLVNLLTTNETYFYREFSQIQELVKNVQKRESKTPITILCAPCATGEEPYSIAIALLEADVGVEFSITGIDINSQALQKAREASYIKRHIGNLDESLLQKYFYLQDEKYILNEKVKRRVSLLQKNIFEPEFTALGKFDYVFSRNMLIYFDKETKLKAKSILESMQKEPSVGVLFGHADLF